MTDDATRLLSAEFWDERYGTADRIWSGNPNPRLVEQVSDTEPGNALDVACGEGADAIWLAERGWQVTGVDVSAVALARAESAARARELHITWQCVDVRSWTPAPETYDLVSAQFLHMPWPQLEDLVRRLAAAVRPDGSLLVVAHDVSDLETTMPRPKHLREFFFTAEQVATTLDADEWRIVVAEAQPREATDPDGNTVTIHDAVCHAVRR